MGTITEVLLTDHEWDEVVKRLMVVALTLVPVDGTMRGLGVGPKDLVQETIRRLWDPSSKVKWRSEFGPPTVPKVAGFLKKVLTNYFLDQLKEGAYTHATPDPGPDREAAAKNADDTGSVGPQASAEQQFIGRLYLNELYARAQTMAETEDDVEVALYLELQVQNGGPYKNAEAAKELGVTAADIVNIRKRLARFVVRARQGALARPQSGQ